MRVFLKLRQQESNLRWGSQSPLPYRLAMAHHSLHGGPEDRAHRANYYTISAAPVQVRRTKFNRSLDQAVEQGQALAAVELADGLGLDLADTLAGDAEVPAHLFQGAGTAVV